MSNVTQLAGSSHDGNTTVVRNVRAEMGYAGIKNQTELANALGVTQMWVSRRLGGTTPITADEIVMFADFFGIEPGDLFTRRGETKKAPTTKGEGRKLPGLDSNQEPIGFMPGNVIEGDFGRPLRDVVPAPIVPISAAH